MTVRVDVSAIEGLAADMDRAVAALPRRVGAALGEHVDEVAATIRENVARNIAPRFAEAVQARRERRGAPAGFIVTTPIEGEPDAPTIINAWEVGTVNHGPRPSIVPAVEKHDADLTRRLQRVITELI